MFKFNKKAWCIGLLVVVMALGTAWMAFAETHSRFVTGNPVYGGKANEVYIISNTLDFSDLRTAGPSGTGILAGVTRGDTVQLLDIPAGVIVTSVGLNIYSAWTTSGLTCAAVTIGDGSDVDGWFRAVDFGPTASGVSVSSGASIYSSIYQYSPGKYALGEGGKYYSAADTIDAVIPNVATWGGPVAAAGLTDFVLRAWATCVKPSTNEAYTKPPAI